ncbi:MAG TPA: fumarylacetoacetate hydrolase family protein [Burkholderiales bacterium]|nr:fumarylacetoacetate hydrolase family protein [Burkholderiales bacterium]
MALWVRFKDELDVEGFGVLQDEGSIRVYGGDMFDKPAPSGACVPLSAVRLLTPSRPSKVIALWNNFHAGAEKLNLAIPAEPHYFLKTPNSYLNPFETIRKPKSCEGKVGFEGELGVVIGKTCKEVTESDAMNYVFGYTCVNDVGIFDIVNRNPAFAQWVRAKGFDTFCPMGPVVATGLDPATLVVKSILDGQERQNYPIGDMIFSVAQLVSLISQDLTLYPGDIITCGTSIGSGSMKSGSTIEIEITGIGKLINTFE